MTATPRVYSEISKKKAEEREKEIYSMDDESKYGKELYRLDFSEAIEKGLLSDYKVLVLAIDRSHILSVANEEEEIDDVAKIVGCWNGLSGNILSDEETIKVKGKKKNQKLQAPMKRAVAFTNTINQSKKVCELFDQVTTRYKKDNPRKKPLKCELRHVDGSFSASRKDIQIDWLKSNVAEGECRILSNARCLSEGVDVPALDAVLFLNPRNSQVDIVQSVGRVMRKAKGKEYGHIILPIVIPQDKKPEEYLSDHKTYKVVWQVLQALRSHDNRFEAMANDADLNGCLPKNIRIIGVGGDLDSEKDTVEIQAPLMPLTELKDTFLAQFVDKCGNRKYFENWAFDVSEAVQKNIERFSYILKKGSESSKKKFQAFLKDLRSNLNNSITEKEAIEMLAQHMVTLPIFNALFENYDFTSQNPVSKSLDKVVSTLEKVNGTETQSLKELYAEISRKIKHVKSPEDRQNVMKELYEKLFKKAFKEMAGRLGIAYTPIEIVDFILNSCDNILKEDLNSEGLTGENVHILDPFLGTGTFLARLIESDLIKDKDMGRKYENEIHGNEIVLLAYYIASINIESSYFYRKSKPKYQTFKGVVLTDTFQLAENPKGKNENFNETLFENTSRIKKQRDAPIKVIVGNPPYSVGQKSENDANKNTSYPRLEKRVKETYTQKSNAQLNTSMRDSYVKAIRWASDRLGEKGIVGFVHNGSLLKSRSTDGLRKALFQEFDSIYCLDLRGDARSRGKQRKKEGGGVFGQSSRTSICITFLVKKQEMGKEKKAKIFYHDIGDYLSREEKLSKLNEWQSIEKVTWQEIEPDKYGDWLNKRDESFYESLSMGDKKSKDKNAIFDLYTCGLMTNRDDWAYNSSKDKLSENMNKMISFYNSEVKKIKKEKIDLRKISSKKLDEYIDRDSKKISWSDGLKNQLKRENLQNFNKEKIMISHYRPFSKKWVYFDRALNDRTSQNPKIWRSLNEIEGKDKQQIKNKVIVVSGAGSKKFSILISGFISDRGFLDTAQCFPLFFFDDKGQKRDGISDWALQDFKSKYNDKTISKEDIFYYIYGVLNSKEYQEKYQNSLTKSLPHIPLYKGFKGFSALGRELSNLHLNYEKQKPLPEVKILKNGKKINISSLKNTPEILKVEKMRFRKIKEKGKVKEDLSTIIFNEFITIQGIPEKAYEYQIGDWSAIKHVLDRQRIKPDKPSGITHDPNEFSDDPSYILNLLLSVISLSVKTVELRDKLPKLEKLPVISIREEKEVKGREEAIREKAKEKVSIKKKTKK